MNTMAHTSASRGRSIARQRQDSIDGVDRTFLLWLLASLVSGTIISGGIAMWAVMAGTTLLG